MRIVIPELLWIGNAREARDVAFVADQGIAAVVDLAANEPPATLLRDVAHFRIPLVDGDGNLPEFLRLAVNTIAQLVRERVPTLVACSYGMSRSPAVTAFALSKVQAVAPIDTLSVVGGSVSPVLWESVANAMQEGVPDDA